MMRWHKIEENGRGRNKKDIHTMVFLSSNTVITINIKKYHHLQHK
jgi:hypothetical protein